MCAGKDTCEATVGCGEDVHLKKLYRNCALTQVDSNCIITVLHRIHVQIKIVNCLAQKTLILTGFCESMKS